MRLSGTPTRSFGLYARITFFFTRRSLKRLAGVRVEHSLKPRQRYARVPVLLRGYATLERSSVKPGRLGRRYQRIGRIPHCWLVKE